MFQPRPPPLILLATQQVAHRAKFQAGWITTTIHPAARQRHARGEAPEIIIHKTLSTAKACQTRTTTDRTQHHPTRSSSSSKKKMVSVGGTVVANYPTQPANPSASLPNFSGMWLSTLSARP